MDYMSIVYGFLAALVVEKFVLQFLRSICFYTTVRESTCQVYTLFGKVEHVINEPGLHFLWPTLTWKSLVIYWLGQVYTLDLRLDQCYLRSQPVNSEEGAPMGIGIWYEMYVSDPVSYLFKNTDPKGSLAANVSNATVRCLSNLPLAKLLEERHSMSLTVRLEVSPKSTDWGYKLGSVYIRKVHFRDTQMIHQIESKVVNRLRQVTATIKQDGENQVNIITNSAQRTAAIEFAKAAAIRPKIVGEALQAISQDPEIAEAVFSVLETQKILDSQGELVLIPKGMEVLSALIASKS